MEFKELVGKKILGLFGNNDELQFQTDGMTYGYLPEGDCCSHSWFEHISGLDFLVGHTIAKVEEIPLSTVTEAEAADHEDLKQYGYRFTTDRGYFEIDMRNSSNGYYGGYVSGPREYASPKCKQIESDF